MLNLVNSHMNPRKTNLSKKCTSRRMNQLKQYSFVLDLNREWKSQWSRAWTLHEPSWGSASQATRTRNQQAIAWKSVRVNHNSRETSQRWSNSFQVRGQCNLWIHSGDRGERTCRFGLSDGAGINAFLASGTFWHPEAWGDVRITIDEPNMIAHDSFLWASRVLCRLLEMSLLLIEIRIHRY
jgi:hypothetical protein